MEHFTIWGIVNNRSAIIGTVFGPSIWEAMRHVHRICKDGAVWVQLP